MYKGVNIFLYCTIGEESGSEYEPSRDEEDEFAVGYEEEDVAEENVAEEAVSEEADTVYSNYTTGKHYIYT